MKKNFDAIKMIREIRNKIYEEIKDMSAENRIKYLNEQGKKAENELRKKVKIGTASSG